MINVSTYVKNKSLKNSSAFKINKYGHGFFLVKGTWITEESFDEKFPTKGKIVLEHERKKYCKGENPDRTSAWKS